MSIGARVSMSFYYNGITLKMARSYRVSRRIFGINRIIPTNPILVLATELGLKSYWNYFSQTHSIHSIKALEESHIGQWLMCACIYLSAFIRTKQYSLYSHIIVKYSYLHKLDSNGMTDRILSLFIFILFILFIYFTSY